MSDLSDLLVALAALIPALGSTFVLVWTTVRHARRPDQVARSAAEAAAAAVVEALADDGQVSAEEVTAIVRALNPDQRNGVMPDDQ